MPTDYSWPRLRAILDEALLSERGIKIRYPTWNEASQVRQNMYKIRDTQRKEARKIFEPTDPSYGVSAYDGLTMWLRSTVKRTDMHVVFAATGEEVLLPDLKPNKRGEDENLYKDVSVTVTVETIMGAVTVENAPSFREAWRIIRQDFPCDLIIENGYSTDHLNIEVL